MTTAHSAPAPLTPEAGVGRIGPRGEGLVVVSEQIAEFGGVERIAQTVLLAFPAATLVALRFEGRYGGGEDEFEARLRERENGLGGGVRAGDRLRLLGRGGAPRNHYLAPLNSRRISREPLGDGTTVLSLGGGTPALAVSVPPGARHVGYVGGPPRALYGFTTHYMREQRRLLRPLIRASIPLQRSHYLRLIERPDRLAVNSRSSAAHLRRLVQRPVDVIHPPVRSGFFTPSDGPRRHFLVVARAFRHKRIDVILEAFRRLGEPLVVAGGGTDLERLRREASPNVRFVGHVDDEDLRELYRESRGLVSVSVEEFGICLAEAQAAGVPVIAPREGGSNEIVRDGETGILLDEIGAAGVIDAVRRLERTEFDAAACRRVGESFAEERFVEQLRDLLV